MIRPSVCPYISQPAFSPIAIPPLSQYPRCGPHVLNVDTPMGGQHNIHCEPPPHQTGAWKMLPTTTLKEGT